ncbi:MAG: DUF1572 family protein [Planctomycetota bacterium]
MIKYAEDGVVPSVESARRVFARQRAFTEHCAGQLDDAAFFAELAPGLNSVGVTMQHVAGNLKSRWTDFLTSDGEKPWRTREAEFAGPSGDLAAARRTIEADWAEGWRLLGVALEDAEAAGPEVQVTIRGVPHSVELAIARQLDHYGYHVGQIATVARGLVGSAGWKWFTVAPGGTATFNRSLGYASGADTVGGSR